MNSFLFWISSMLQIHRIKENWNVLNACYVTDVSYSLSHVALLPMLLYCYLPFNNGGSWVWVRCRNWQMLYVCLLPDSWCTGNRAYELLLFCWEQALVLTPWNKDPVIVQSLCPTLCNPLDCSRPGFPVLHHLLELSQTCVHWIGDATQPSHSLSSLSPPAFNLCQLKTEAYIGSWLNSAS